LATVHHIQIPHVTHILTKICSALLGLSFPAVYPIKTLGKWAIRNNGMMTLLHSDLSPRN